MGGSVPLKGSYQAEVEALRAGLLFIQQSLVKELKGKRIVIQSDCTGALEAIAPEMAALRRLGASMVYTKHVKGHQGHATARNSVNTLCDRKAKEQVNYSALKDGACRTRDPGDLGGSIFRAHARGHVDWHPGESRKNPSPPLPDSHWR